MNFSSENFDGVHPYFMEAIATVNNGFEASYGNDRYTAKAFKSLKNAFGAPIDVKFTFNGTGANNLGLSCITSRHHAIFCSDIAHIYVDEATAPEAFTGCRLYPIPSINGKITIEALHQQLKRRGDMHHPQASVVSITQPTEYGTIYSIEEIKAISNFCKEHGLLLHVDGARFFNAAVALQETWRAISTDVGIDVLTLGGTKIGMLFGEAVIFFNPPAANSYKYVHKRSMQLASKNRFIAAQFEKVMENNLWYTLACYTNQLASYFEKAVQGLPNVSICYLVQTNVVFLNMPKLLYQKMQAHASFYYWDEQQEIARLVFSFSNTREEIIAFVSLLKQLI